LFIEEKARRCREAGVFTYCVTVLFRYFVKRILGTAILCLGKEQTVVVLWRG